MNNNKYSMHLSSEHFSREDLVDNELYRLDVVVAVVIGVLVVVERHQRSN